MRLISDDAIATVTIFQEAEGEPYEGKLAVGEVIRNRMKARYNSDGTVVGTCLRDRQFSGWNASSRNRIRSVLVDSVSANECAIAWQESRYSGKANGAVLYFNPELVIPPPAWADPAKLVATIGHHQFYTA